MMKSFSRTLILSFDPHIHKTTWTQKPEKGRSRCDKEHWTSKILLYFFIFITFGSFHFESVEYFLHVQRNKWNFKCMGEEK